MDVIHSGGRIANSIYHRDPARLRRNQRSNRVFTTEAQRSAAATKHSGPKKLTAKNAKYAKEEIGLSLAKPQRRKDLGNKIRSGLV
jgi:hypothetical protein